MVRKRYRDNYGSNWSAAVDQSRYFVLVSAVREPIELWRNFVESLTYAKCSLCHGARKMLKFIFYAILRVHHNVGFVLNLDYIL